MDINLCLDFSKESSDILKYACLYFDNITVDTMMMQGIPVLPNKIANEIHLLEKEGIVQVQAVDKAFNPYERDANLLVFYEIIYHNLPTFLGHEKLPSLFGDLEKQAKNCNLLYIDDEMIRHKAESFSLKNPEVMETLDYAYNGNRITVGDALEHYENILAAIVYHVLNKENVLSNSIVLNELISKSDVFKNMIYSSDNQINVNTKKLQTLRVLLPYINVAEFEDVLFLRTVAKDEIEQMRFYLEDVIQKLNISEYEDMSNEELNKEIERIVKPSIKEFERKVKDCKLKSARDLIANIQNPLSYAPLIASFTNGLSPLATLIASMGMIGAKSIIEHKINENELKSDPLYFTVSLRKIINSLW